MGEIVLCVVMHEFEKANRKLCETRTGVNVKFLAIELLQDSCCGKIHGCEASIGIELDKVGVMIREFFAGPSEGVILSICQQIR